MEFPKPDCTNCGHASDIGQCQRTDGQCKHIYTPRVIEHVAKPIRFHRSKEAMEYERFINRDASEESVAKGKWCHENVINDPENVYIQQPQPFEMDEDEKDD